MKWLRLGCCSLLATQAFANPLPQHVNICDDGGEWPPLVYQERVKGEPSGPSGGLAVELISTILSEAGVSYSIELLPWKRCLLGVEKGQYHMLLAATMNDVRRKTFLSTVGHSWLVPHYFYRRSQFPTGLVIQSPNDLSPYRVGGILGYNYDHYGVKADRIETLGIHGMADLMQRLKVGAVDVVLESFEVIAGFRNLGQDYIKDLDLGSHRMPGTTPTSVHMLLHRSDEGEALRQLIDDRIVQMIRSGELVSLQVKYVGTGMVLPR